MSYIGDLSKHADSSWALIDTMRHFALYLFSFAANTLVVLTAPEALLRDYVLTYNLASVVFSLLLFVHFSRFATVSRSLYLSIGAVVLMGAIAPAVGWYAVCILAYPGLLILTDYLVTQSHGIRVVTGFRFLMIISALPFLLFPDQFVISLGIRVAVLAMVAVGLAVRARESHLLSVKSPIRFQVGNYAFYNGTLWLIALLMTTGEELRWWYLSIQVGLVLILKVLDYSMRRAYSLDVRTRWLAIAAAACIPLPVFIAYPNVLALGLFYVGFVGLVLTGRYISS